MAPLLRRYYGCEFMKDFQAELELQDHVHWYTYPINIISAICDGPIQALEKMR